MNKRLIWVEGDDFTGWCCSHCTCGITAPHLESTVAALAFNRLAQETFEKHNCADHGHRTATLGKWCPRKNVTPSLESQARAIINLTRPLLFAIFCM